MSKHMALKPRVTEKGYALSELKNVFVFEVPVSANRLSVKNAVESQYEVGVAKVNITRYKGKTKRTYRLGGRRFVTGRRADTKRAYVTLKEGDTLPIYAAINDEGDSNPNTRKDKK